MNAASQVRRTPGQRLMFMLWPSFLVAGALEVLVFTLVDPQALHGQGGVPLGLSDSAVYSLAFFAFWAISAAAASMSQLLERERDDINTPASR